MTLNFNLDEFINVQNQDEAKCIQALSDVLSCALNPATNELYRYKINSSHD